MLPLLSKTEVKFNVTKYIKCTSCQSEYANVLRMTEMLFNALV